MMSVTVGLKSRNRKEREREIEERGEGWRAE